MEKVLGVRTFVAVALVSALALGSTGCRSGWKVSNPFSKAPKAAAETPSELDDMELTPPPENYTSNERKNSDSESNSETSFAQNGKYDAGYDGEAKPAATSESTESALADASTAPNAPIENFKTPSYEQNYQTAPTYNLAQTAPQYGDLNAQTNQTAQTVQSPQTLQSASFVQNQALDANVATNPTSNATSTNVLAADVAAPNVSPIAAPVDSTPFPAFDEFPSFETAQTTAAPTTSAPAYAANAYPSLVAPANAGAVEPNAAFPTASAFPASPAYPTANETAYSTINVADQNAQIRQTVRPETSAPIASYAPSTQVAQTPQTTTARQSAQPVYVAQNVPEPAATNAAPNANQYSDVYYQPQTTSGGFAPGSSALY